MKDGNDETHPLHESAVDSLAEVEPEDGTGARLRDVLPTHPRRDDVLRALKEAEKTGCVVRTGRTRGTKWHIG